ncbi:MAG: YceI family protein [Phaeodactylibacter sp.]|uniref:YceI family protein n=1 Tax=Phaeodactylibacter sp. TaxID=1940289 RepID=UPI0032EB21B6
MKKAMLYAGAALIFGFALTSCGQAPTGEKVEAQDEVETTESASNTGTAYRVNTEESLINWTGSKMVGDAHNGFIRLQEGQLNVEDGKLTGGTFAIDMTTLSNTDIEEEGKRQKLEGHLKSDEFFNVGAHPTATFKIAKVEPVTGKSNATHTITGNLTMKGITKSVTIPANISMEGGVIKASTPQFVIDRTQWEVMYGASALGVVKDNIIRDEVALEINLIAAAQ